LIIAQAFPVAHCTHHVHTNSLLVFHHLFHFHNKIKARGGLNK
jgi:hypothetical protein